jgi:FKBP-type peptidyl-prolyl cis-trans isomerase FkpA
MVLCYMSLKIFKMNNRFVISVLLVLAFIVTTGCSNYSDDELIHYDTEIQQYIKEKGIDAKRTESGLYYFIEEEGDGSLIPYDGIIGVTYKGTLIDGHPFDTQLNTPVELSVKNLVLGWREAMLYVNVGSSLTVIIPPQLAYKKQKRGVIPENSILIFSIKIHYLK